MARRTSSLTPLVMNRSRLPWSSGMPSAAYLAPDQRAHAVDDDLEHALEREFLGDGHRRGVKGFQAPPGLIGRGRPGLGRPDGCRKLLAGRAAVRGVAAREVRPLRHLDRLHDVRVARADDALLHAVNLPVLR